MPTGGRQEDLTEGPAAENPAGGTESLSVRRPDFQLQELESFELNLEHATGTNSVASMWSGTSDPTEPASPVLKMAAPYLTSRLNGLSDAEAQAVRRRLRLRLGILSPSSLVTGKALHDAVNALGLTRYKLEDMNAIVNLTSDFIELKFQEVRGRRISLSSTASPRSKYGRPIWKWPPYRESMVMRRSGSMASWVQRGPPPRKFNCVPAEPLMTLFLAEDAEVQKRIFGPHTLKVFQGVREILLAGDTNRLVAELTFVRINDLAAPPEPLHPLLLLEPFVALLIVANGVMTGVQTEVEDWEGWLYFELVFATALLLEILLRISYVGCRAFWCGPDMFWNWFDQGLLLTGIIDLGLQIARDQNTDIFAASLLRLCRLVRLVRIVKIFRLKFMSELRLMVKGLVAGIRTLLLAFSLLFAVIYVISGFTFMMIGNNAVTAEFHLGPFFETLPLTMFTAFRCFIGECIDDLGQPIPSLLARAYGLPFVLGYVSSYMLVALGIFNVILAVYVDITMKAAKESEAVTAEQHFHESIRVARTTRELLKKFAAAYRLFHEMEDEHASHLDITSSAVLFTDEEIQDNITITKELFLLVIQDQEVQRLMDDLDMPVDRANMFEIIDADGSGNLQITELVQGLLKIRGEVNKGDTVASLLATKAVQRMIMELRQSFVEQLESVKGEVLDLSGMIAQLSNTLKGSRLLQPSSLPVGRLPPERTAVAKKPQTLPGKPELGDVGPSRQPEVLGDAEVSLS